MINTGNTSLGGAGSNNGNGGQTEVTKVSRLSNDAGYLNASAVEADVPAGWYFSINRLSGTTATIVNCFTQSMA